MKRKGSTFKEYCGHTDTYIIIYCYVSNLYGQLFGLTRMFVAKMFLQQQQK